jgi:hypothetical protein
MEIFYTQEFLEYMATTTSTMSSLLTKGNIDGCTITDNVVVGPFAERKGKTYKTKGTVSENTAKISSKELQENVLKGDIIWDFSTTAEYQTITDFFYGSSPSQGMLKTLFETCFNSTSEYVVIPFDTTSDFAPSTMTMDWGGTEPAIYWGVGDNSLVDFWNCTVGSPLVINSTNIEFYFDASTPEYQCTMPTMMVGFGTEPDMIESAFNHSFTGFIVVNNSIKIDDKGLILYGGVLDEPVEVGSNASVFEMMFSADVIYI